MEPKDRAYWITWYNLPDEGKNAHLTWAHEIYMPKVLARPGVLWAAHYASEENVEPLGGGKGRVGHTPADTVPAGDRFIMMFGAVEPHVFANPSPSEFHASLPDSDRDMLAQRWGERWNIMIEEARIYGPDAKRPEPDLLPAPCIQLGSFNAGSYEEEEEMAAWYARWRLPSLQTLPGCVRVRKLVSVAGWAKHACFYEFTSLKARNERFVYYERANPQMEAWSKKVVRNTIHAPGSANVAQRIWPKV